MPALIERNTKLFGSSVVQFRALDASREPLPRGDICLIRQVLQHLSNEEIEAILQNCESFPVVVITEHFPSPRSAGRANLDKPHGGDTRLVDGSWVDVTEPPFSRSGVIEELRVQAVDSVVSSGETIRTFVWNPAASPSDPSA